MARLRDPGSPAIPANVLDDMVRRSPTGSIARFMGTAASMPAWLLGEDQLRALAVPVRLVWGVSDQLFPLDYAKRMAAVLPDVELIPVERCGHIPSRRHRHASRRPPARPRQHAFIHAAGRTPA